MANPSPVVSGQNNKGDSNGFVEELLHEMESHPSVVERYYKPKYCINVFQHKMEDQCVLIHSNRVCLITVARSHPIFNHKVANINFQVSEGLNRMNNKVTGKSKRGAQWLGVNAPLCKVTCEDGKMYTLISCVKGQLLEVNEALVDNPQLLLEKPQSNGYIAIVLPRLDEHIHETSKLLSEEEYQKVLEERKQSTVTTDMENKEMESS